MQIKAPILAILCVLLLVSCSMSPQCIGMARASCPAPMLGIVVDQNLQVMDLEPRSPAEKAGVQVGDILLDLAWISFSNPNAPRDEHEIDTSPILFTDRERIRTLMNYQYILELRVKREDQITKLTIQPALPTGRKFGEPTATPLWPPNDLF